ncbi:unnamed protein product [Prunus armeniaca]
MFSAFLGNCISAFHQFLNLHIEKDRSINYALSCFQISYFAQVLNVWLLGSVFVNVTLFYLVKVSFSGIFCISLKGMGVGSCGLNLFIFSMSLFLVYACSIIFLYFSVGVDLH